MPKVSIYLSSYNHAPYLREAIESILNQSFSDYELFIEDDASVDESWSIIQSYSDPRIRSFRNSANRNDLQGMRAAILRMAVGEYIAIHNSDDVWEPGKLQKQVSFLDEHPRIGAVFSNALAVVEKGNSLGDTAQFYSTIFDQPNRTRYEWLNYFFYHGNALCHPSVLIRKKCYDECGFYRAGLNQLGDFDMWVRLCLKYEIHVLPEKLVRFRVHANNVSADRAEARIQWQFEFLRVLENYTAISTGEELTKVFPSARKYVNVEGCDLAFALAMVALEGNPSGPTQLFAMSLLFDALNEPARAKRIKDLYGFGQLDFVALGGQFDIFSVEATERLTADLEQKEQAAATLSTQIVALSAQIEEMQSSLWFRVTMRWRVYLEKWFPPYSRRRSTYDLVLRGLRTLVEAGANGLWMRFRRPPPQPAAQIAERDRELTEMHASKGWRLVPSILNLREKLLPPNSLRYKIVRLPYRALQVAREQGLGALLWKDRERLAPSTTPLYRHWMLTCEPYGRVLKRQRRASSQFKDRPLISIVTPVYNTPIKILRGAVKSVLEQTYDNWELCIANGSPEVQDLRKALDDYARQDQRIKVTHLASNLGIAGNTNAALAMAGGEYVGFLDHDDVLAPFALFEVVKLIGENRAIDVIYSDEDKITPNGRGRHTPFFKPAFSPDFLEACNYMPHFLVVRRKLGEDVGWLRDGFEGSQDYDLVLRCAEQAREIAHIPQVLYHWRAWPGSAALVEDAKADSALSGLRAIEDHLQRMQIAGTVQIGPWPNTYRVIRSLPSIPLVSIIIPNMDHADDLRRSVESILTMSSYTRFEIIIVENNSREEQTWALYRELAEHPNVRVIPFAGNAFNYSIVNNFGADHASGEILLFLNNDVAVITPDWLERMLENVLRPEVGIVGAKLYYPNNTVQHGGVILGVGGVANHSHYRFPRGDPGYFCRLILQQNLSAVTGACLMIRKQVFREVGGFDPGYQLAFGDVDFCVKALAKGYLVVYTPYAELYHHESKTRGVEDTEEKLLRFRGEVARFQRRWSDVLARGDDYYNPNLTLGREDFSINTDPVHASVRIKPGFRGPKISFPGAQNRHGPDGSAPDEDRLKIGAEV